jgi:hypothetical protein
MPSTAAKAAANIIPPRKLQYGAEAKATAESNSNSNMYISTVLQDLYRTGHLKAAVWKNIEVPGGKYSEKQSLKNTLELVEKVISKEQRTTLKAEGATDEWLELFGKEIEKKCMAKMLQYEGIDPDIEHQTRTKKKATYLAVGQRVRVYKKYLADLSNSRDPNKEVLRDRPMAPGPATPNDTVPIHLFLTKRSK